MAVGPQGSNQGDGRRRLVRIADDLPRFDGLEPEERRERGDRGRADPPDPVVEVVERPKRPGLTLLDDPADQDRPQPRQGREDGRRGRIGVDDESGVDHPTARAELGRERDHADGHEGERNQDNPPGSRAPAPEGLPHRRVPSTAGPSGHELPFVGRISPYSISSSHLEIQGDRGVVRIISDRPGSALLACLLPGGRFSGCTLGQADRLRSVLGGIGIESEPVGLLVDKLEGGDALLGADDLEDLARLGPDEDVGVRQVFHRGGFGLGAHRPQRLAGSLTVLRASSRRRLRPRRGP